VTALDVTTGRCARDPRIVEALTHADLYGVAEYMAAGPELVRDWEDAWSPAAVAVPAGMPHDLGFHCSLVRIVCATDRRLPEQRREQTVWLMSSMVAMA
jgi:hypothetical protein